MIRLRDGRVLTDLDLLEGAELMPLLNASLNLLAGSLDLEGLIA
jgi:hypothetical protein